MLTLKPRRTGALSKEVAAVDVNPAGGAGCLFGEPRPELWRHAIVVEAGLGHEAGHVPKLAATREGKIVGSGYSFSESPGRRPIMLRKCRACRLP
jgi:hypothetical protein